MTKSSGSEAGAQKISYQGEPGANSHLAAREAYPDYESVAYPTFEDALAAVKAGEARYAMIRSRIRSRGGSRTSIICCPNAGLYIIGEHFLRVRHQLMAKPGASLSSIRRVMSHTQALGQCRATLRSLGLKPVPEADTAGSARLVSESDDLSTAAIASRLAAEIYGLEILKSDVEDQDHNTTRFIILAKEPDDAEPGDGPVMTTFLFRVRNVPAALYKALGGFATNGVNMTKIESYQEEGTFNASRFFADIEGHPVDRPVQLALEELSFFSTQTQILGTYLASPYRKEAAELAANGLVSIKRPG